MKKVYIIERTLILNAPLAGLTTNKYIFQYFNHHNLLEKGSLEKSKKVLFLMAEPFFLICCHGNKNSGGH